MDSKVKRPEKDSWFYMSLEEFRVEWDIAKELARKASVEESVRQERENRPHWTIRNRT